MEKVRYGIIGMGNQGSYYAKLFADGQIENGEVTAMCDNNKNKLGFAKQKFGENLKYFDNYRDMIKSGVCDAVLVETPHYQHPSIVIDCLNNGLHVLCDKPAGVYTEQVKKMNEVAKQSKVRFGMMFNQRTNCLYRKMREMIANGDIGTIQRAVWVITDWFRTQAYYDSGDWRATWAGEGGGVLINQCPHQIDLFQWVLGKMPKNVRAICHYGKWHDVEVEDDVTAYFEYDDGATGVFITTTGEAPGTNRFEISGSKGKLLCENNQLIYFKNEADSIEVNKTSKQSYNAPKCEKIIVETDGKNLQHVGILNNFSNAILGLEDQFVQGVEGIDSVELMNAIALSGWQNGNAVSIPVNEKVYLDELNKRVATSRLKTGCSNVVVDTSRSFGTH